MRILYLLIILAALAGCAIFGDDKEDETADWSAEKLYAEGKESLESEYYTKAVEYYEKLLARHPFGVHAQQAQLDLAYAYYKNDESASAVAACDRFIKLYPDHSHVDYAYYLKGLANFSTGQGTDGTLFAGRSFAARSSHGIEIVSRFFGAC